MNQLRSWVLIILSLLFYTNESSGQHHGKIDSLRNLLSTSEGDTNQVKILFKLSWEHLQNRGTIDSSRYYADLGLQLCQKLKFDKGIAQVHYYYGLMDRLMGNYESGIYNFRIFAEYQIKQGDSLKLANALYQLGVIYNYQGDFKKSLETYFRILKIYESENDPFMIATTLNSIGIIYKDLGQYDEAIDKYHEALDLFESLKSEIDMADCLHNLGNVYALQKKYNEALSFYEQSLRIDEKLENEWGIAYQLESISGVYIELGNYSQALSYGIRSLEIREQLNQKKELASSLNKVGEIYRKLGDYEKAITYYQQSLDLANTINLRPGIKDAYLNLSFAFSDKRDFRRAYEYHRLFSNIKDSLFQENMMEQINELSAKYESDKKEKEIQLLNQNKEIQQAKIRREKTAKNTFIAGFIILVIVIFIIIWSYRQKIKSREMIASKNEEINKQKIIDLEKNQKLLALDAMITGQEVERKRIAQDLHDGLGALLSTVQMHFNSITEEIKKLNELDIYSTANTLLDEACQEVRKIAHNMMPGTLLKLGLIAALKDLCNKIMISNNLKIDFHAFNMEDRLDETVEITIYRLVQEALNNIIKHAKAKEVIVQLSRQEDSISITVEDDGVGFYVSEAKAKNGMGIRNLDSRVKYLDGELEINSEPGKGTSINIELPINKS